MNLFYKVICRAYQQSLNLVSHFLNFRRPETLEGKGSLSKVPSLLKKRKLVHPLIVTDGGILALGLTAPLEGALKKEKIPYGLFGKVVPNPTFAVVYQARDLFLKEKCDSLIAFGGGSAMDTAKAVAALISNPKKELNQFRGELKVRRRKIPLLAVPTTAGTGSEATIAAVLVNEKTKDKFSVNDPVLIPDAAILDPDLLAGLPNKLIASTGMDALTHAVEAYIGHENTKGTKEAAREAIRLIYAHLYLFYADKNILEHREAMQKASYLAGVAFTRAYVGYVHALAHALGGKYGVPHGYANAVLLPHVLKAYGKKAEKKLAELSDLLNLTPGSASRNEKSRKFISWIEDMKDRMSIPEKFPKGTVAKEDLGALALHAAKEGNPLYPVPKEMDQKELQTVLESSCEF